MVDLNQVDYGRQAVRDIGKETQPRPHEIYENTQYIPNRELRLLDIPLNSSISFQKMLFYHATYVPLYIILMLLGEMHRLQTRLQIEDLEPAVLPGLLVWIPIEFFRLRFGYRGNINETFPELIAFQIFTVFFDLPLTILPLSHGEYLPHERACCGINIAFVFLEFVYCAILIQNFVRTQSAVFFLRTAPLIDKNFMKKYTGADDMNSTREI